MATAPAQSGPTPTGSVVLPASGEQLQNAFDNSIWYLLSLWHPLHIAVTNAWGGPTSADKRDWFAGAVSHLLTSTPQTDNDDLECFLLQIMQDEFECNVEDESEVEIARSILACRKRMMEERTTDAAREVEQRWKNRGQMKGSVDVQVINQETEDYEEWQGIEEEDGDEMDGVEVPQLVAAAPKEKVQPEVDDDGFTKVVSSKKKR